MIKISNSIAIGRGTIDGRFPKGELETAISSQGCTGCNDQWNIGAYLYFLGIISIIMRLIQIFFPEIDVINIVKAHLQGTHIYTVIFFKDPLH